MPAALRASGPIPNPLDWARDKIVEGFEALLRRIVEDFMDVEPVSRFVLHTPDLVAEDTLRRLWLVSLGLLSPSPGCWSRSARPR